MTDLMILWGNNKIAIEAKFAGQEERKEKTVAQWLKEDASENKAAALQGCWDLIQPFRRSTDTPDAMAYQFLHRTASACCEATQAVVVYQIFYDNETPRPALEAYKKRLADYVRMINPNENLTFYRWEIDIKLRETIKAPFAGMRYKPVYDFWIKL
jgi:hypothetical protein